MLKKVLKYDLQNVYKLLIIFYSLALFFGTLTRVFLNIENSFIMNIIGQVCGGVSISMMFNILINNLMRLWLRFKQNMYGDESYLTHTLPIEKKILYLSKIITAIISLFTSILVIALTIFIAYYSKENLQTLKNILLPVVNVYDSTIINILLAFIFIFFLEFANTLQAGYTGIILGHKMNNNKVGFSILFGFVTYIIIQLITLLMIFIVALFNQDIMNLFISNELANLDIIKVIIYMSIVIYTINLVIGYIVNLKLFKQGVNVE